MVTSTAEAQTDMDEDEIGAGGEATDDSPDAEIEPVPSKEVDPLAELRAQVGAAARRDELEVLRNQVRSELGRSQRLEARLEAMAGVNPLADVDPRLDANENLLTGIAQALAESDLTDDRMKGTLRGALAALNAASGKRAEGRMRMELKADILKALPQPAAAVDEAADNPWAQANADVIAELGELLPDFDISTIPASVWEAGKAKGSPARAVAHVVRWASQQAEAPAVDRTAARRQAAGEGAPARNGAGGPVRNSMSDSDEAFNNGTISLAQYQEDRKRFSVGLAPGGGR